MSHQLLNKHASPILITGPAFSGKSRLAQQLMGPMEPVTVIGTAVVESAVIRARIDELQAQRPGGWQTIETAGDISPRIEALLKDGCHLVLDSFSLWLAARLVGHASRLPLEEQPVMKDINFEVSELISVIRKYPKQRIVIVTAEAGGGPSPKRSAERLFRMLLGTANCQLADLASTVVDVRCGIPMIIKQP